ncbi:MAG: DUF3500 domain-containing protein [Verrucomicrobia bacterium]|nr:DUF3500 domain-containing protein [Verrucomicrobiota bacterium]
MKNSRLVCVVVSLFLAIVFRASAHSPAEEMSDAANNFLASLTSEQQAKARFELRDEERKNWHFIPKERKGLPIKEMTPAQRNLAHALLASGLSQRGYAKAVTIMSLEDILRELEQGKGPARDPERYFVSIFGKPGDKETWAWRVEGHHLSINFTIANGNDIAATPSFMGTNPAEVRQGPRKGLRVLAVEEDLARQLVKSFNDEQKKTAIYTNTAPADIITGAERKARILATTGLPASRMNKDQSKLLLELIREYVYRHRAEVADRDLEKIRKAGFSKVYFAWAGGLERGEKHYYRIQGPTFLMEYDNTQNDANHIHAVWRDFENDFGDDLLRRHYEQTPHPK